MPQKRLTCSSISAGNANRCTRARSLAARVHAPTYWHFCGATACDAPDINAYGSLLRPGVCVRVKSTTCVRRYRRRLRARRVCSAKGVAARGIGRVCGRILIKNRIVTSRKDVLIISRRRVFCAFFPCKFANEWSANLAPAFFPRLKGPSRLLPRALRYFESTYLGTFEFSVALYAPARNDRTKLPACFRRRGSISECATYQRIICDIALVVVQLYRK